jgi:Rod binding domain-containing protein
MDVLTAPPLPALPPGLDPALLSATGRPNDARAIDAVATGFESMFASLLVKQMRQGLEPDTLFGGDQSEVLSGLFDFFLGQHVAQAGGLGIGAMIRAQLRQTTRAR